MPRREDFTEDPRESSQASEWFANMWDSEIVNIFDDATNGAIWEDRQAIAYFHVAFVAIEDIDRPTRAEYQHLLADHLWDRYGIDFWNTMDWEAYREWYDAV